LKQATATAASSCTALASGPYKTSASALADRPGDAAAGEAVLIPPLRLLLQGPQNNLVQPHVNLHPLRRGRKPAQGHYRHGARERELTLNAIKKWCVQLIAESGMRPMDRFAHTALRQGCRVSFWPHAG
jgi:hypothetical protein